MRRSWLSLDTLLVTTNVHCGKRRHGASHAGFLILFALKENFFFFKAFQRSPLNYCVSLSTIWPAELRTESGLRTTHPLGSKCGDAARRLEILRRKSCASICFVNLQLKVVRVTPKTSPNSPLLSCGKTRKKSSQTNKIYRKRSQSVAIK